MKPSVIAAWVATAACFVSGLWAFDMGPPAEQTYPTAGAVCPAGSAIAAALIALGDRLDRQQP